MIPNKNNIVFIDNSIQNIYKTLDVLKQTFANIFYFNSEEEGMKYLQENNADIILLNLDLQPLDAITFANEILKLKSSHKPFTIIYSDKQDDFIQELAFNSEIDSFISFHKKPAVLLPFLKNLISRLKVESKKTQHNIQVDEEKFIILVKNKSFTLPKKEFKLFELLHQHPDKIFSKKELAQLIWNDESVADKRIIDVHIYNIRKTLGRNIIRSQKGKGYKMNLKFIS
ncbi:MAG: response regulator transcription factor [Sphingobacteriaceae bacterium]|nr:response regulator transcription factor [Sphingobacteriaceae bacterium]